MSTERDRILFDVRVMVLQLGTLLAAFVAFVAMPDTARDLGGLAIALVLLALVGLQVVIGRWRRARVAAGRPVEWTGAGMPPEKEGFGRFMLWLGLCFAWMIPAAFLGNHAIGQDGAARLGWALITLGCWAEAARWMCAPGRADAHEDELYGFALGACAPVAFPVAAWVAMSEAPGWWAFVVVGLVGAPLAVGWQARRARRLTAGQHQPRGADGAGGLA